MESKELVEYLDQKFKAIDERFNRVEKRFDNVDVQLEEMDRKLDRLEHESPEHIMSMLKHIKKNTDDLNTDMELLTGKVANHERILNRISKQ